jgi:orotate phosphoribosyltransferase
MLDYQQEFIQFALQQNALRFGQFTLKSGRISPYFFNAGLFATGKALSSLGSFYASALKQSEVGYEILFGPAYKGIPLASATAIALARDFDEDTAWAFNRKEAKDHGEGGSIVGTALAGRIMIIDDVITAGTAIREVIDIIRVHGAVPAGVIVALDRQEKGKGALSAIQEIEQDYQIPVASIIKLEHLLEFLQSDCRFNSHLPAVAAYREQYGI